MPACSHRDLVEDPLRSRRSLQEYERLMALPDTTIHPTAIVDAGARIGPGSRIWHWVHVCGGAVIGENCSLGQNVFVGNRVSLATMSRSRTMCPFTMTSLWRTACSVVRPAYSQP